MTEKKRAVGYIRVSTPAHATEEKVSLDEQLIARHTSSSRRTS